MATPVSNSATVAPVDASNGSLNDEFINGLVQGSAWQFGGGPRLLTYSFNLNDTPSGGPWTAPLKAGFVQALTAWANVANITFAEVGGGGVFVTSVANLAATLTGSDLQNSVGAVSLGVFPDPTVADTIAVAAGYDRLTYPGPEGDVFFDNSYFAFNNVSAGGWGLELMMHEVGHALGLKHPFDDGGNSRPTFSQLGIAGAYENIHYTLMAYADAAALFGPAPASPMVLDMLAIQAIYGANMSFHTGNDTYRPQSYPYAIWDAGGTDTLDFSGLGSSVIDLRPGSLSNFGGMGEVGIAYGVTIENAVGSAGNDSITGNDGGNFIDGGNGTDVLIGGKGDDIYGVDTNSLLISDTVIESFNEGVDAVWLSSTVSFPYTYTLPDNVENLIQLGATGLTLTGNALNNLIVAHAVAGFSNLLRGGAGDDTYLLANASDAVFENAGEGTDTVQTPYSLVLAPFIENLTLTGTASVNGGGNDLANRLSGNSAGNILSGGAGDDTLDGAGGVDTADYGGAAGSVIAELWRGFASADGQGGMDTLTSIENLTGGNFADTLAGDARDNVFTGGGGFDQFYGGAGSDWSNYAGAPAGVAADLAGQYAIDGQGAVDYLNDIENLAGSAFNDYLSGSSGNNLLRGGAGNDSLVGGGGSDTADYANAAGAVTAALWNLQTSNDGQGGADYLNSIENLSGSAFNDVLSGDGGNNVFKGGAGFDQFYGGDGSDTADYSSATAGVTAALWNFQTVSDGQGASDYLSGIENLVGSAFDDVLIGDGNNNVFKGGASFDQFYGGSGRDTADYTDATSGVVVHLNAAAASNDGQGASDFLNNIESVVGSAFDDVLGGGAGNDTLDGAGGVDAADYSASEGGVVVELWRSLASGDGLGSADTLLNFENIWGGQFSDTLVGDGGANVFRGGGGFDGLFGGAGSDTADYSGAANGISVALWNAQTSNDGEGAADYLNSIENVIGSAFNDVISGDSGDNRFKGGAGFDQFYGGTGIDTADYADALSGVSINLASSFATSDGFGASDYLNSIENLIGSAFADTLNGNSQQNRLEGGAENDTLFGGAGNDDFVFASGSGVDVVSDFISGQGDRIYLQNNINNSGIATAAQVLANTFDVGGHATIELGAGNSVTLIGVNATSLTAGDFVIF